MKCAQVNPNLGAFVLGGLEPEEAARIRHHLALCPGCRNEHRELEKINQALQAAPPPADPPAHLKEEILSRVREEELSSSSEHLPSSRNTRFVLAVLAAAALVAIVAFGPFSSLQTEPPVATTVQLVPTPTVREEDEDYWGVADLYPQPLGSQLVELKLNNLEEPDGRYEMWFVSGEKHVSAGAFTTAGSGETRVWLTAPSEARNYRTLLITEEPATADASPSGEVILWGETP